MTPRKGLRIRLANLGDPAPHRFVSAAGPPWVWGLHQTDLGVAMSEDAAIAATWRHFREHAVVPEAGAEIVALETTPMGTELVMLKCRSGAVVDYRPHQLKDWEVDVGTALEEIAANQRSRSLAAGE